MVISPSTPAKFVSRGQAAQRAVDAIAPADTPMCRSVATWIDTRPYHMTPLELRLAAVKLEIKTRDIEGPAIGAIIGEAPGPNTSPKLPIFPFPASSAGGRLMSYSRMRPAEYLGKLYRKNLFTTFLPGWCAPAARELASYIERDLADMKIRRVLLLGTRVGAAFEVGGLWSSLTTTSGITFLVIPHPSGRCRVYNDEAARKRAGAAIRWAAHRRKAMP